MPKSPYRAILGVLGWIILGVVVGILFGLFFWWLSIVLSGHKIGDALQGRVEDALGRLEGLIALGIMVGGAVGLTYGIARTLDSRETPKNQPSCRP